MHLFNNNNNKFILNTNLIKSFSLLLLLLINRINIFIGANPIKFDGSSDGSDGNNVILYANIGQFINISCVLDSSSNPFARNYKRNSEDIEDDSVDVGSGDDSNNLNEINFDLNKYEIDWMYLDKNGKMKFISEGNYTLLPTKYKLYVEYIPQTNNNYNYDLQPTDHSFAYYLSALIESDDDEGVYECINPNWPNFTIKKITVAIARNNCSSISIIFNKQCFFLSILLLLYFHYYKYSSI